MDTLSFIFLPLTCSIAVPATIVALVFASRIRNGKKAICLVLCYVALALAVGAVVNAILGLTLSRYSISYSPYGSYTRYYRHPCAWVAMGLGIGAIVVGLVSLLVTLRVRSASNRAIVKQNSKPVNSRSGASFTNSNYIEEIKQLKELLDSGALTQEEFDAKKKEILDRN